MYFSGCELDTQRMLKEWIFDDAKGIAEIVAANEIRHLPGRWAIEDLAGLVDGYLDAALLPSPFSHPKFLCARSGLTPILDRLLPYEAALAGSLILYRPIRDPKHLGFVLRHELAEGILVRERSPSNHADVQIAACFTLYHSRELAGMIRRNGAHATTRALIRGHRWAPAWMARVRVAIQTEAAVRKIDMAESA